jgi:hypothetical protein
VRISVAALLLLVAALAAPAPGAAAGACQLSTSVSAGQSITVSGSGFDPNATVEITQDWSGSNSTTGGTGPQTTRSTLTTDASGSFEITVDAGPGHGGTYHFMATSAGCTASADAVAVETAGGIGGGTNPGGGHVTPPPTDTAPPGDRGQASTSAAALLAIVAGFGLLGLGLAMKRARRRTKSR